jgi:hypothetical protein
MLYPQINLIAVAAAATLNIIVGSFWYSPLLFGNTWIRLTGMGGMGKPNMKTMLSQYGITFASAFVMCAILSYFIGYTFSYTTMSGALAGFLLWLGFIATSHLGSVVFGRKPKTLYLIDASYYLTVLVINGALLAVWQ